MTLISLVTYYTTKETIYSNGGILGQQWFLIEPPLQWPPKLATSEQAFVHVAAD